MSITMQMIVKNEERWVWFAIQSVLPWVNEFLIFDTGSTDRTVEIIKAVKSEKLAFEEKGEVDRKGLVRLRREQLKRCRTEWFLLVDGDEIWPEGAMKKLMKMVRGLGKETSGVVCRTRNCVGDVEHYLPESEGEYKFFGQKGHFNLRVFRKVPELGIEGEYPLEAYTFGGKPLAEQEEKLVLLDDWYLHVSHLPRSSVRGDAGVMDRGKKYKWGRGLKMRKGELPKVLLGKRPEGVEDPFKKGSLLEGLLRMWGKLIVKTPPNLPFIKGEGFPLFE
jgi:glycosyltransferase involved in cell wall biosynthesis